MNTVVDLLIIRLHSRYVTSFNLIIQRIDLKLPSNHWLSETLIFPGGGGVGKKTEKGGKRERIWFQCALGGPCDEQLNKEISCL